MDKHFRKFLLKIELNLEFYLKIPNAEIESFCECRRWIDGGVVVFVMRVCCVWCVFDVCLCVFDVCLCVCLMCVFNVCLCVFDVWLLCVWCVFVCADVWLTCVWCVTDISWCVFDVRVFWCVFDVCLTCVWCVFEVLLLRLFIGALYFDVYRRQLASINYVTVTNTVEGVVVMIFFVDVTTIMRTKKYGEHFLTICSRFALAIARILHKTT